eukprot:13883663-Ditylum_brightwellii.AAC.1
MGLQAAVDLAAEKNQNLTSFQKELLHWHQRLCHCVKQKRRPHKATKSQQNPEKEDKLKKKNLFPGQHLSADHY